MGCCISCCMKCIRRPSYSPIPDDESVSITLGPMQTTQAVIGANNLKESVPQTAFKGDDPIVCKGTHVRIKFTTKNKYDRKLLWIDLGKRSINMSNHESKERSHKEAKINDIINIIAGPPTKVSRKSIERDGNEEPIDPNLCLTVNFSKGGGIDIIFNSANERNYWFKELNKLVLP